MVQAAQRSLGELYFTDPDLGDARRNGRLAKLFDAMVRSPGGTLPTKLSEPADLRAFYRLVNAAKVTHASVMQGHYAATRASIRQATAEGAVVLRIHDGTEIDYSKIKVIQGSLGQVGPGTRRGYICHNSLAVRTDTKAVLGLTSQILHHRADTPADETVRERRERGNRESRLWVQGVRDSGKAPEGGLVVDVSDALSDTYEYMYFEVTEGHHFLLRSKEDRKLATPINGQYLLYAGIRTWRSKYSSAYVIQAQEDRVERTAQVNISFGPVELQSPNRRRGDYSQGSLSLWAVRMWEPHPPEGETPFELILLTNVAVESVADADHRLEWYRHRPIVEEYHKGMKTGCGIENMQFDTIDRLEPALGIVSILATTLLQLRDAARQPDAEMRKATTVVDKKYVRAIHNHYRHRLPAVSKITVKQFYMHVARLGGHQNRKCDGFPGWITLWRGWMRLHYLVEGAKEAKRLRKKCGKK